VSNNRCSGQIFVKLEFPRQIFEKSPNIKFCEKPPVGAAMFYADGQTHDEVNSRFSRFSKELNKWKITLSFWDNKCHARHIATPLKRNFYIINTRRHDADDLIRAPRPSDNLAFFITDALSSLSTALGRHLLTCVSSRPFSAFSSHLNLGLPVLLLTSDLHSNIFLTVLR